MTYPEANISSVANFINGFPFKPEDWGADGYPIIRIQNLTDPTKLFNRTIQVVPRKYLVQKGDILVSWSATIDVFEWDREDSLLNQHIFKVEFNPLRIDKSYFKLALRKTIRDLTKYAHGSTMKHVVKGDFDNHPIPLPPLDDQVRIAHLLGKVEGLIAQRKQHLQQLDDLLKSVFLEMFGDPVRNEKGWNTPTLIEVADFENGDRSSNYPSGPDLVDDGILFLSTKNIVNNRLDLDSNAFITQEKFESLSRGKASVGDVLITLRGTLGSCCIYDSDKYLQAFINAQMMIMRPKALIRSIYLHAFITSTTIAGLLQRIGNGAAVPQLTATQLKSLKIPLPPPELQEEFAVTAEKIEVLKYRYQQSLCDLEALYGALSQQAFKGELDLSRVPMPGIQAEEVKIVAAESLHAL